MKNSIPQSTTFFIFLSLFVLAKGNSHEVVHEDSRCLCKCPDVSTVKSGAEFFKSWDASDVDEDEDREEDGISMSSTSQVGNQVESLKHDFLQSKKVSQNSTVQFLRMHTKTLSFCLSIILLIGGGGGGSNSIMRLNPC